jgi:hypothetical protein
MTDQANSISPAPEADLGISLHGFDEGDKKPFNVDDLIPAELRQAAEAAENPDTEEEEDDSPAAPVPPTRQQAQEDDEEDIKDEGEEPSAPIVANAADDDELDLSPEAIQKLIKGDPDAIKKPKAAAAQADSKPFWHEDEEYKELVSELEDYGVDPEAIDKLIRKVSDKSVVDNGKLLTGLETKLAEKERLTEEQKLQINRLQQIERALMFDESDETKEKYLSPMKSASTEIRNILSREGVNIPVTQLLTAPDRTAMINLLKDAKLEDGDLSRIANQWRNYKDLEMGYFTARDLAAKDLKKAITVSISPEVTTNILKNTLSDFAVSDPRFDYINTAIKEGLAEHPEVNNIVARARNNFQAIVDAMSNPTQFAHNQKWLGNLAKFFFESAHHKHIEDKYYDLDKKYKATEKSLRELAVNYQKLAGSARGITGKAAGVGKLNASSRKRSSDDQADVEQFEALLKGKAKLSDIIPSLKNPDFE